MRHLLDMRKAFVGRKPASIRYRNGAAGDSLEFVGTGFATASEADLIERIRACLLADEVRVIPATEESDEALIVPTVRALCGAVAGLEFGSADRDRLKRFARRFPPVLVKLYPLHRYGFTVIAPYRRLHHDMIEKGAASLQAFVEQSAAAGPEEEARALRVFLILLLLGLIVPDRSGSASAQRSGVDGKADGTPSRASILSRIIRRVRGL